MPPLPAEVSGAIVMEFDPDFAILDLERFILRAESDLRWLRATKDIPTLLHYKKRLGKIFGDVERSARVLQRGDNWVYYCEFCPFEYAPNTPGKLQCPHCGEGLRFWDLDKGTPRRRATQNTSYQVVSGF